MNKWQRFWRHFFNAHKWMAPRLIPRRAGYKLVAKVDWPVPPGNPRIEIECEVRCTDTLLFEAHYYLHSASGPIKFKEVVCWREV